MAVLSEDIKKYYIKLKAFYLTNYIVGSLLILQMISNLTSYFSQQTNLHCTAEDI